MAPVPERATALLDFWFNPATTARRHRGDDGLGRDLAESFGTDLGEAATGALEHWIETPQGAVALVLLLAMVPREVFRGKYQAFAFDSRAIATAEAALLRGHDRALAAELRAALYAPFGHSESLSDQRYCVSLFEQAEDRDGLEQARQRLAVIEQFGRFPDRNRALEREDTPEETQFLNRH